jgi:hypothetical protein
MGKENARAWTVEEIRSWNIDEAWAAHEEAIRAGVPNIDSRGPIFKYLACVELDAFEMEFTIGHDRKALLAALRVCARCELPMPEWLATAFGAAYDRIAIRYEAKSWDDAFGNPIPKHFRPAAARKNREVGVRIYMRITEIIRARKSPKDAPLDERLFASVGKEFGVSRSDANKLYYLWKAKAPLR